MSDRIASKDRLLNGITASHHAEEEMLVVGRFRVEVLRAGKVIEEFEALNLVVNEGINYVRDVSLLNGTQVSAWFFAPTDASPTIAAGDTYASHAGWAEVTAYDEANRQAWTGVAGAVGVAGNSAAPAELTIASGGTTIGGAAIVGGGTNANTKGDTAGGGTLLSVLAFTGGNRILQESDVLRLTWIGTVS